MTLGILIVLLFWSSLIFVINSEFVLWFLYASGVLSLHRWFFFFFWRNKILVLVKKKGFLNRVFLLQIHCCRCFCSWTDFSWGVGNSSSKEAIRVQWFSWGDMFLVNLWIIDVCLCVYKKGWEIVTESGKGEGYKILVKLGNAWVKKKKLLEMVWSCAEEGN